MTKYRNFVFLTTPTVLNMHLKIIYNANTVCTQRKSFKRKDGSYKVLLFVIFKLKLLHVNTERMLLSVGFLIYLIHVEKVKNRINFIHGHG